MNNTQKAIAVLSKSQDISASTIKHLWNRVVEKSYRDIDIPDLKEFFKYLLEQNHISKSMVFETLDFYGNEYHHLNVRFVSDFTLQTAVDGRNSHYSKWITANIEKFTPQQLSYAAQQGDRYLKTLIIQSYKISSETVEETVYGGIDDPKHLDSALVRLALEHPITSTELTERLWKDRETNRKSKPNWGDVERLDESFATQGNTPVYILEQCYVKGNYMTQLALIWNPKLPDNIAKLILKGDEASFPDETFIEHIVSVVGVKSVIAEADNAINPWHEPYQSFLMNPDNFRINDVVNYFKIERDIDLSAVPAEWIARTIGWKDFLNE